MLRNLVVSFVTNYESIYYRNDRNRLQACLVNVHTLLHLPDCVEQNGPATCYWSYPIERFAYEIKQMATGKQYLGTSIANQAIRIEQLNLTQITRFDTPSTVVYPQLKGPIRIPVLEAKLPLSYSMIRRLQQITAFESEDEITYWKRYQRNSETTFGSLASQREAYINRDNHHVSYALNDLQMFGSIYSFIGVGLPDHMSEFALIQRWTGIQYDDTSRVITFGATAGNLDIIHCSQINYLVGMLNGKPGTRRMIIAPRDRLRDGEDE